METTKEKILEASKVCPDAKKTLEVLYPEVFGASEEFKVGDIVIVNTNSENSELVGTIGKVMCLKKDAIAPVGVHFQCPNFSGHDLDGRIKEGRGGWWLTNEDLELVYR